jgi:hypothetical protein
MQLNSCFTLAIEEQESKDQLVLSRVVGWSVWNNSELRRRMKGWGRGFWTVARSLEQESWDSVCVAGYQGTNFLILGETKEHLQWTQNFPSPVLGPCGVWLTDGSATQVHVLGSLA